MPRGVFFFYTIFVGSFRNDSPYLSPDIFSDFQQWLEFHQRSEGCHEALPPHPLSLVLPSNDSLTDWLVEEIKLLSPNIVQPGHHVRQKYHLYAVMCNNWPTLQPIYDSQLRLFSWIPLVHSDPHHPRQGSHSLMAIHQRHACLLHIELSALRHQHHLPHFSNSRDQAIQH